MSHSIIPPTAAGIWGATDGCTGWVLMNQLYPETDQSSKTAYDDASHWVASEVLSSYLPGMEGDLQTGINFIGAAAPNGVVIDEEMAEGAMLYVTDVLKICQDRGLLAAMQIDQRLEMPSIHELSFGTPNAGIYDNMSHELFIWGYEFGYGVVNAFENWQLINYYEGFLKKLGIDGYRDQTLKVNFRIVQPRAYHREGSIRTWSTVGSNLRGYVNTLNANAHKSLGPDAECNSGPHCKGCSGRHACEAALTGGTRLFEAAAKPVPLELSNQSLGVQLSLIKRAIKQLEDLESGYEAQITSKVRTGEVVPGWVTVNTFAREDWNKPLDEVFAMGDMFEKDLRKPKAITPNQARKLGVDEAVITAYSSKQCTGIKVVPDNENKAKQVFML